MEDVPGYAELGCITNFSFLEGASHPEEMVACARELELRAIGIADRNTLAGVVRAHAAARDLGVRLLVGARLIPLDGPELIVYPEDRIAYGRLSRLLSLGKLNAPKGECHFRLQDVLDHCEGWHMIVVMSDISLVTASPPLKTLLKHAPNQVYFSLSYPWDGRNLIQMAKLRDQAGDIPLIATNLPLYHRADRRPLQDVLTCIREHVTIHEAGYRLYPNAERHLKPPLEMYRLFKGFEDAIANQNTILNACTFSLDELKYEYPDEPVPSGKSPQSHLEDLTWQGARQRYPNRLPDKVQKALTKELKLIDELSYAPYFLTVHDIVAWARGQNILCQGRGSAANSAVCYCLGITSVDPDQSSLLFERFISRERKEPPDIDVDFEHERREEVIQYIYQRYGRHKAALTATVISYRARSAVREVCKALGLTEDIASALARTNWGSYTKDMPDGHIVEAGLDPSNPMIRMAMNLVRTLIGFPRHLSQHVGGFVLTRGPLVETVPIGNAAMDERTFIEWDKDDIETLGIMKVDVLALGMLTCIRKAFDMIAAHKGEHYDLATVPKDDPAVYNMLCEADSLGVFQVESRAQMNMLPRLRPRCFYDLVIEVAIVRPGPIQGDMVHPYLRRRKGLENITYPSPAREHGPPDEIAAILDRTLGVPLFQEQAMQIAIDAAKFTPEQANGLRRAMATFRKIGTIQTYQDMMVQGMVARGYDPDFAQRCFDQVKGFGEYGFPESHAASFALLVYISSWIKHHHPDVFCAALLNSQPMGFYAPAQIVRDAREHGVDVLAADVNFSNWDNHLELSDPHGDAPYFNVRLGFRQIDGFREDEALALIAHRGAGYESVDAIRRRTHVPRASLERLAAADAFRSMGHDRRAALWSARGEARDKPLPLFATQDEPEQGIDNQSSADVLPDMPLSEHVIQDYQTTRLSLKAHPMSFLRQRYQDMGICTTDTASKLDNNAKVQTAGVVLVRQRPGTASGVVFITLEDETGIANLVVWPKIMEKYRPIVMGARILGVRGKVQSADNVTHIVAYELMDRTGDLDLLTEDVVRAALTRSIAPTDEIIRPVQGSRHPAAKRQREPMIRTNRFGSGPGSGPNNVHHPRDVRIIPKSRDFH